VPSLSVDNGVITLSSSQLNQFITLNDKVLSCYFEYEGNKVFTEFSPARSALNQLLGINLPADATMTTQILAWKSNSEDAGYASLIFILQYGEHYYQIRDFKIFPSNTHESVQKPLYDDQITASTSTLRDSQPVQLTDFNSKPQSRKEKLVAALFDLNNTSSVSAPK